MPEEIIGGYFSPPTEVLAYQDALAENLDGKYQQLDKNILKEDYKLEMKRK